MMTRNVMFCFGLGYTARALVEALSDVSWRISGTSRSADSICDLPSQEIQVHQFSRDRALSGAASILEGVTHILSSIPPDAGGDCVIDHHGDDMEKISSLSWVGYLSSVGVYGDRDGAWIDETSECRPSNKRNVYRVAAEHSWLELGERMQVPVQIFRLAGIYGPGRNPVETARRGQSRRIIKPGQVFSRIHVDDIVSVLLASMAQPSPGAIYNVCDDEPAPPQDVVEFACELAGCEPPSPVPYEEAELSLLGRSFYAECKRVRNDRIKKELGVQLRFSDYRSGLRALVAPRNEPI